MTTVTIKKYDILDFLAAASDNGNYHAIPYVVEWHGPITIEEIEEYSKTYTEEQGYGEEDIEFVRQELIEIFGLEE